MSDSNYSHAPHGKQIPIVTPPISVGQLCITIVRTADGRLQASLSHDLPLIELGASVVAGRNALDQVVAALVDGPLMN